jgi:hypothetical protein
MWIDNAAFTTVLLSAAIAAGCSNGHPAAKPADVSSASSIERAGTLSVTAFRFSGWHDESFHYLPSLSVTAPSTGRPVSVQRVDFTADEAGTRRLLKGVRYAAAQRIQPGGTLELVTDRPPIWRRLLHTLITSRLIMRGASTSAASPVRAPRVPRRAAPAPRARRSPGQRLSGTGPAGSPGNTAAAADT